MRLNITNTDALAKGVVSMKQIYEHYLSTADNDSAVVVTNNGLLCAVESGTIIMVGNDPNVLAMAIITRDEANKFVETHASTFHVLSTADYCKQQINICNNQSKFVKSVNDLK